MLIPLLEMSKLGSIKLNGQLCYIDFKKDDESKFDHIHIIQGRKNIDLGSFSLKKDKNLQVPPQYIIDFLNQNNYFDKIMKYMISKGLEINLYVEGINRESSLKLLDKLLQKYLKIDEEVSNKLKDKIRVKVKFGEGLKEKQLALKVYNKDRTVLFYRGNNQRYLFYKVNNYYLYTELTKEDVKELNLKDNSFSRDKEIDISNILYSHAINQDLLISINGVQRFANEEEINSIETRIKFIPDNESDILFERLKLKKIFRISMVE